MSRRTRLASIALTLLASLLLGTAVTALAAPSWLAVPPGDDGLITILILGSDEGPIREGNPLTGRADGFHIMTVSQDRQHVSILSFPRDSWVDVPGMGRTKINASLTKGPENAVAAAEALTGVEIDEWILTDFAGFIMAIQELGGVQIDVQRRLKNAAADTDLHPGVQRLDGFQALALTRDRKSRPTGDLGRSASHGRMLAALHAQIAGESPSLVRMSELVSILRRHTVTSASPSTILKLAYLAVRIPPQNVQLERVDVTLGTVGSQSVVFLTRDAYDTIEDIRLDGVIGLVEDLPLPSN